MKVKNLNLKKVFLLFMICVLILGVPGSVFAEEQEETALNGAIFNDDEDRRLMIGENTSIPIELYDGGDLYTGTASAYIEDEDENVIGYYTVSGSQGNYTINNVKIDYVGTYILYVYDSKWNTVNLTIYVDEPELTISGELSKNKKTKLTGTLTAPGGKVLKNKTITVDGTDVGLDNTQSVTTSYDGTFSFWITPTEEGELKFLYYDHEINSIIVDPAYSSGSRVGYWASGNVELSVSVAQQGWTSARRVILTRDDNLADSLTAVPLSKLYDAPILMCGKDQLDPSVLEEISLLKATVVIIIGGEEVISKNVENELINSGCAIERIAGADRYETAALIAAEFNSANIVYLAYGHGEPDALAASSFASRNGIPILLTDKTSIPTATKNQLARLAPYKVVLLGGTGVIDSAVENELKKSYVVERWGGNDRYDTEWVILRNLFTDESKVYFSSALVSAKDVTSGKPYGDALLSASLAAKQDAVAICIPQNYLPKSLEYFLTYNRGYISKAQVVGNTTAVSSLLEKQIEQLLTR